MRPVRSAVRYLVCGFVLLVSLGVAAQPFRYQWLLAELAAADGEYVEVGVQRGRALHRLRTDQMRLLYAIGEAIETVAEIDVELIVVDGAQPNAFAGRGKRGENIVGINFAMIEMLQLDAHAAAALIGHEIAHLKLAHGEERASRATTTGILGVIGGVVLGGLGVPGGETLSRLTVAAVQSDYSREHEREADYLGTIWAVEAGFEAAGAVRLHEALGSHGGGASASFLSSHPSGPERIATLKALATRLSRPPAR